MITFFQTLLTHPGQVYPTVLKLAGIALVAVLVLHLVLSIIARKKSDADRKFVCWNLWEKLVYVATIVAVADLAVTSFYAVLSEGVLHGWLLLGHMVGSGAFVALLVLVALTWANSSRFGRQLENDGDGAAIRFTGLAKVSFWLFLLAGLATMGSMLASMLPLFGSDGLHELLDLHRYAGLAAVIAFAVHVYSVVLGKLGLA